MLLGTQPTDAVANQQTDGSSDGACRPLDPLITAHAVSRKESSRDADQQYGTDQDYVEGLAALTPLRWSVLLLLHRLWSGGSLGIKLPLDPVEQCLLFALEQ